MFEKLSYTWELMGASWNVLKRTKGLLIFPLLSGIFCLAVIASFIVPLVSSGALEAIDQDAPPSVKITGIAVVFLFYFCCYFVITFFNVAIVAGAISRIAGGEPTVAGCLREAVKRIHLILGWALVQATVSLILRIIEARAKRVGKWITAWLGAAWALLTFLVVPVLVVEEKGPIDAFKESASLLKRTWGEQIAGNFGFGLIFFLLMIPGLAVMFFALFLVGSTGGAALAITLVVAGIVYLVVLSLVQSALQAIFQAAVYMHTQGVYGEAFPVRLLNNAMSQTE